MGTKAQSKKNKIKKLPYIVFNLYPSYAFDPLHLSSYLILSLYYENQTDPIQVIVKIQSYLSGYYHVKQYYHQRRKGPQP